MVNRSERVDPADADDADDADVRQGVGVGEGHVRQGGVRQVGACSSS